VGASAAKSALLVRKSAESKVLMDRGYAVTPPFQQNLWRGAVLK
jgi:hypothetical protein